MNCFDAVGARANTRFTVLFTTSSGAAPGRTYAHMYADATGGVVRSYSSVNGTVTATRVNRGVYLVTLAGMATGDLAGSVQVTAVGGAPRRCKADSFAMRGGDYDVWVACYETLGGLVDTAFTLSYHHKTTVVGTEVPPAQVAYILAPGPAPPNTNSSSSLGAGANVVAQVGVGTWEVTYPEVAGPVTHMQVTAFDDTPHYCQLADAWATVRSDVVAPVACFRPGGVAAPGTFFATYADGVSAV